MSKEEENRINIELGELISKQREMGFFDVFLQEETIMNMIDMATLIKPNTPAESMLQQVALVWGEILMYLMLKTEFTMNEIIKANPTKDWNIAITTPV